MSLLSLQVSFCICRCVSLYLCSYLPVSCFLYVCVSVTLSLSLYLSLVTLSVGARCEKHRKSSSLWFRLCPPKSKSSLKCSNHGVCVMTATGKRCVCDPPYKGRQCQLSPSASASASAAAAADSPPESRGGGSTSCIPNPCRNGGICHRTAVRQSHCMQFAPSCLSTSHLKRVHSDVTELN